jgi:hypothetical protein
MNGALHFNKSMPFSMAVLFKPGKDAGIKIGKCFTWLSGLVDVR